MMSPDQYHLAKIAEEAVEVAQRAIKAQQFGLGERQPGQDQDNLQRLISEWHDLYTTFDNFLSAVDDGRGLSTLPDATTAIIRLDKMSKYLKLSKALGQTDEDALI